LYTDCVSEAYYVILYLFWTVDVIFYAKECALAWFYSDRPKSIIPK